MIKDYKAIVENCYSQGIELYVEDGKLKYKSISGALSNDILNELKSSREGLIEFISIKQEKHNDKNLYSPFPLSPVQSSYLFGRGDLYSYGNVSCHIYQEFSYNELDVEKVQKIWNHLINKHDMLRAVIYQENYQEILEKVSEYKLKTDDKMTIRKELEEKIYPLGEWPMFDIGISKDDGESILHFSMDFLIADWSSIWLLLTEFEDMYFDDFYNNESSSLSFKDYRIYEERKKESLEYEKAKEYWKEKTVSLKSAPTLPIKNIRENEIPKFKRISMTLNKKYWQKFKEIAQQKEITPTAAVLTVYSEILKKWSTNKDFSLNLTLFNKKQIGKNIGSLVGDFTNTSIISAKDKQIPFKKLASEFNEEIFSNLDHSIYSGVEVLRDLAKINGNKEFLLPYVFTSAIGLIQKKLRGKYRYGISQTPQVFIDCQAMDTDLGLQINWDIRDKLFEEGLVEDMFKVFEDTLNQLAKSEDIWDKKLTISIPNWQKEERMNVNDTEKVFLKNTLIFDFLKNVINDPEKIAIIDSKKSLSYNEVYKKAVEIAITLREKSINKGDYVVVKLPHNADQVSCILGILMIGAAYVPVDIDTSKKRFESIVKQCNSKVVITDKEFNEKFAEIINVKNIEVEKDMIETFKVEDIDPYSIAYVIFTSGTTGVPKGVLISHSAALNTICDINERFGVTKKDSILAISKLNFDLSVYDIFGMLSVGGTIVYPNEEDYLNPIHWDELVKEYSISVWNTVPALMELYVSFLKEKSKSRESMQLILLSGDWVPLKMPDTLKKAFPKSKIIALGGATEASIWSNYHEYKELEDWWNSIPYGKPLSNQQFYVLDERLEDCPVYCEGNLYISGSGLAEGYLGDEKLTKEKFFIHPKINLRLYSTGDLGRYLPGGEIEFLGRKDNQVKIRGYRIELGEIKNALIEQDEISDALVRVNKQKQDLPIEAIVTLSVEKDNIHNIFNEKIKDLNAVTSLYEKVLSSSKYNEICKTRDEICLHALLNALLELGIFTKVDDAKYNYDEENIKNLSSKYTWLLNRWINQLEESNIIYNEKDNCYTIPKTLEKNIINQKWDGIFSKWENAYGDINLFHYIKNNIDNLIGLLQGKIDPVGILYPEGSDIYTKALYETSINSILINEYYCKFLEKYIKEQKGRKIRILEIGAGTGATAKKLIDILGDEDYEYHFTDSQKYFLPAARNYFNNNKKVLVYKFNVDEDPIEQGLEYNYFDIIVAAYVLENAKNIPKSLKHIRNLAAPKGYLLFSEPVKNEPWILVSQAFMMQEPLDDFRENIFFLTPEQWLKLLSLEDDSSKSYIFPEETFLLYNLGAILFIKQFKKNYTLIDREKIYDKLNIYLPQYMILSSILFTESFKLNRNGKVDILKNFELMPKLDKDTFVKIEKIEEKLDSLEEEIMIICSKLFGNQQLNRTSNFYDYGADSLILAKVATELKNSLKLSIPFEVLLRGLINNPTVADTSLFIKGYVHPINNDIKYKTDEFIYTKIYKMSGTNQEQRIRILIHGAFGNLENFNSLATELAQQNQGDILVVGVSDVDKYLDMKPIDIVPKLSDIYYEKIMKHGFKNVQIIGYSFSGVVAIEIARSLLESGIEIDNLSIIEGGSISEINSDELTLEFVFLKAFKISVSDLKLQQISILDDIFKDSYSYENVLTVTSVLSKLRLESDREIIKNLNHKIQEERFDTYFRVLEEKKEKILSRRSFSELYKIFKKSFEAQMYIPDMYFGDIDYYIAQDNTGAYKHFNLLLDNWRDNVIGNINKYYIPGDHYSAVQDTENAKILAELLKIK